MREEEEAQKKFFTFFSPLSVLSLVLSLSRSLSLQKKTRTHALIKKHNTRRSTRAHRSLSKVKSKKKKNRKDRKYTHISARQKDRSSTKKKNGKENENAEERDALAPHRPTD
jgi:hypothetical protein